MAHPFQIGCQNSPKLFSNPTDSWAILYSRFAAESAVPEGGSKDELIPIALS
jgi:hypothetical protein